MLPQGLHCSESGRYRYITDEAETKTLEECTPRYLSVLKNMIDTLSIARKLSSSGGKREQAEAIAGAVADVTNQQYGTLAIKDFVCGEISSVRGDMDSGFGAVHGKMDSGFSAVRGEISAVETRLVRWVVGTGIVVILGFLCTVVTIP